MNTTNEITWTVILSDLISKKARVGLVIIRIDFKYKLETKTMKLFVHRAEATQCSFSLTILLSSKYFTLLISRSTRTIGKTSCTNGKNNESAAQFI